MIIKIQELKLRIEVIDWDDIKLLNVIYGVFLLSNYFEVKRLGKIKKDILFFIYSVCLCIFKIRCEIIKKIDNVCIEIKEIENVIIR